MRYEQYDLLSDASRALSYINNMTDKKQGRLPYWLVLPHKKPAEAEHCKVDDAELVGSWFDAVDCLEHILGKSETTSELYTALSRREIGTFNNGGRSRSRSAYGLGYVFNVFDRNVYAVVDAVCRGLTDRSCEELGRIGSGNDVVDVANNGVRNVRFIGKTFKTEGYEPSLILISLEVKYVCKALSVTLGVKYERSLVSIKGK